MHRSNKVPFKGTLTSKAFSIFLALTLCVPTTLAGNLSHVRQAQADVSVPQEQSTGGDALDSAPDGASIGEAADSAQAQGAPDSPAFRPLLIGALGTRRSFCPRKGSQSMCRSSRKARASLARRSLRATPRRKLLKAANLIRPVLRRRPQAALPKTSSPRRFPPRSIFRLSSTPQLGSAIRARIRPRTPINPLRPPLSARASTRRLSPAIGSRWSFQKSSSPQMKRLRSTCSKTTSKATPQR